MRLNCLVCAGIEILIILWKQADILSRGVTAFKRRPVIKCFHRFSCFLINYHFILPAPSQISKFIKEAVQQRSIQLSWQEPHQANGAIKEYEIKYYEKASLSQDIRPAHIIVYKPPTMAPSEGVLSIGILSGRVPLKSISSKGVPL